MRNVNFIAAGVAVIAFAFHRWVPFAFAFGVVAAIIAVGVAWAAIVQLRSGARGAALAENAMLFVGWIMVAVAGFKGSDGALFLGGILIIVTTQAAALFAIVRQRQH